MSTALLPLPDPQVLAEMHAQCFTLPRPWPATEIVAMLADPTVFLCRAGGRGFLIGRVVLDEAEVLTLAVDPCHRREGIGATLLRDYHEVAARRGAAKSFLEVAADNIPALALYGGAGYVARGRRLRYYTAPGIAPVDALILGKSLAPEGEGAQPAPERP